MTKLREIFGYVLGGLLFVLLIPAVMWFASGRPAIVHVSVLRASVAALMMLGGLAMSIWTIVYMRQRGKGNPMDVFGHEVAPRTQHLMTDGPYRINSNPMLTKTLFTAPTKAAMTAWDGFVRKRWLSAAIPFATFTPKPLETSQKWL